MEKKAAAPNTTNNIAQNALQKTLLLPLELCQPPPSNPAALSAGAAPKRGNSETPPKAEPQAKCTKIGDDMYRCIGIAKPKSAQHKEIGIYSRFCDYERFSIFIGFRLKKNN
ncbi:unnamed protein product [Caenorhabditis angaria]|uniref:Uncharacterized protein n=1 Tax=Caenorhabditis angaria TaxID=860376 RepID=A0A9P1I0T8_9PELO|nr:unnamed protein product [Caenorhabditis angaria]